LPSVHDHSPGTAPAASRRFPPRQIGWFPGRWRSPSRPDWCWRPAPPTPPAEAGSPLESIL